MNRCSNCGAVPDPGQRFCTTCGRPLSAPAPAPPPTPSGPIVIGSVLGARWEAVRRLGQGGMGSVWLVRDLRLPRRAAIKELLDNSSATARERADNLERFNREADTLATLQHEYTPHIYDRFTEGGRVLLVMEFIEGLDLGRVLDGYTAKLGRPLSPVEVARVAYQLTSVLEYLHSQQVPVIHRDLKPANLMLTASGTLKLIDFGIAKAVKPGAQATMLGTHGYAAPEQYRGQVEPRSDLYAMGATMHHLLTGQDPQKRTPFDFPALAGATSLPAELARLVDQLVSVKIEDRPASAAEVQRQLLRAFPNVRDFRPDPEVLALIRPRQVSRGPNWVSAISAGPPTCPQCSAVLSDTARFCNKCGYRLVTGAPSVTSPLSFMVTPEILRRPVLEQLEVDNGGGTPVLYNLVGIVSNQSFEFAFITPGPQLQAGAPVEVYLQRTEAGGHVFSPIDPTQAAVVQAARDAWQQLLR